MQERRKPKANGQIGSPNFLFFRNKGAKGKEVCNRGVACSLLKLGSLERTVIASLFHSGLHPGTIFCGKNDVISYSRERQVMLFFDKKKSKKCYDAKLIF